MLTSSESGELIRRVGYEEAFRIFKVAGLDAMDFPVDGGVRSKEALKETNVYGLTEDQITDKFSQIRLIAQRNGIAIGQTHSVFGFLGAVDPDDMDDYIQVTIGDIVATRAMGCDVTVVHPIRLIGQVRDMYFEEGYECNLRFFRSLIPACRKYNVRVAIENTLSVDENKVICATQYSDPKEIVRLVRDLGEEYFCTCADTGHFALTEKDTGYSVGDCIRIFGNTLGVVHIQEVDRLDDRHTVPYTYDNTMDWEDIYSALREVGFRGPANLEVMSHLSHYPDCPEMNLEAMRHISAIARYVASRLEKK